MRLKCVSMERKIITYHIVCCFRNAEFINKYKTFLVINKLTNLTGPQELKRQNLAVHLHVGEISVKIIHNETNYNTDRWRELCLGEHALLCNYH